MESISILMEMSMKEIGLQMKKKDMEFTPFRMEISTKDCSKKALNMERENITSLMAK